MISGKCKENDCGAPEVPCHNGLEDFKLCPHFVVDQEEKKEAKENIELKKSNLSWTGESFTTDEISKVSSRNSPIIIGIVGTADAGKTSFLGMVYTLLINGKKFANYTFAGTKTILGWDKQYYKLKFKKGKISWPDPTPANSNRLYHFALRDSNDFLKDILFSDASGEVFSWWSVNVDAENAENARWIYSNANAFLLFLDCDALVNKKNLAKREIMLIARQLTNNLKGRPIIVVWSKSDKKREIVPDLISSIKSELSNLYTNYLEIDISNLLDPGPDELVHKNNLEVIDEVLDKIMLPSINNTILEEVLSNDLFVNYKGK